MKQYENYMDRQCVSELGHEKLLRLERDEKKTQVRRFRRAQWGAAAAAALALAVGLGVVITNYVNQSEPRTAADPTAAPTQAVTLLPSPTAAPDPGTPDPGTGDEVAGPVLSERAVFFVTGPAEGGKLTLPAIQAIHYDDTQGKGIGIVSGSIKLPDGSFANPLSMKEIQKIFWGPEGKPAAADPKTDPGDLPLLLKNWAGYTVAGEVRYDGEGDLWTLGLWGDRGEDWFSLQMAMGGYPPACFPWEGTETQVLGVPVLGRYTAYDQDGDGEPEYEVTSRFMVNGIGVQFTNCGSGGMRASEVEGGEATGLGGAMEFNAMVVNYLLGENEAPYLDHLAHGEAIPPWQESWCETLEEALAGAADFEGGHPEVSLVRYLPKAAPAGFGQFESHLSYQEGTRCWMLCYWYRGYDSVQVMVSAPEGGGEIVTEGEVVDVNVPESYDWRLYDIPICENVPEEYQKGFYQPVFRAEDMSPEVIAARRADKDTESSAAYNFTVLHADGTTVRYSFSGVSEDYIWSLMEATLG